jgi:hypothetical protein
MTFAASASQVRSARVTKELGAAGSSCHPENARQLVGTRPGAWRREEEGAKRIPRPFSLTVYYPIVQRRARLFFPFFFLFFLFFIFCYFLFCPFLPVSLSCSLLLFPSFLCAAHPADWPIAVRLTRPPHFTPPLFLSLVSLCIYWCLSFSSSFFRYMNEPEKKNWARKVVECNPNHFWDLFMYVTYMNYKKEKRL